MAAEQEVPDPFRHCLKVAVSALCTEVGFESAESSCVETLTELTTSLLTELGRSARAYCELAGRVEPVVADLVLALVELGMPLEGLRDYAVRGARVSLAQPTLAVPAKQTAILHTGNMISVLVKASKSLIINYISFKWVQSIKNTNA